MNFEDINIFENKLILPKQLLNTLKWKFPFYRIPNLDDYSQQIIDFSKTHNQLPFYSKLDLNNDGNEEIVLVQKPILGGYGRLLIISIEKNTLKFDKIKWDRPVNSLFFDYLIDIAKPREYQRFGLFNQDNSEDSNSLVKSKKIIVKHPHLITKGYLERIVYWDGFKYRQERISTLNY